MTVDADNVKCLDATPFPDPDRPLIPMIAALGDDGDSVKICSLTPNRSSLTPNRSSPAPQCDIITS